MKNKKTLIAIAILGIVFVYGYSVGRYHVFPYNLVQSLKEMVLSKEEPQKQPTPPNTGYRPKYYPVAVSTFKTSKIQPDVIMLGDSITQGCPWNEFLPNYNIANRGIGGDTSYGILDRLDETISKKPKYVFLLVGINDLGRRFGEDAIVGNIMEIAKRIKQSGSTPVVQSILPVSSQDESKRSNSQISEMNATISQKCSELGISFLDITSIVEGDTYIAPDGLHIMGPAYSNWSRIIEQFLDGKI